MGLIEMKFKTLTTGPKTEENPYIPPPIPVSIGRSSFGATQVTAVVTPVKIPALEVMSASDKQDDNAWRAYPPRPAIARPTMNAFDVGETAQISDPISKINSAIKKIHLTLKNA
jgi:hypothetical protein